MLIMQRFLRISAFLLLLALNTPTSKSGESVVALLSSPEKNFEELWQVFNNRYAFFEVRGVDWQNQYEIYRPLVTESTTDDELFDIMCNMLKPLNDGHVELKTKNPRRRFCAEDPPRFWREFTDQQIEQLFEVTENTLKQHGFGEVEDTATKVLTYAKSTEYAYLRIVELEGHRKKNLTRALADIAGDFKNLEGYIIDLRECPGGDDHVLIEILNRFTDKKRVAFHRKTKKGPGDDEYGPLKTWYIEPDGEAPFTGPIILLTCDSVFSGGDVFALVARELPHVTIVGEHTNGIFSYQLEGKLSNGWKYCLSHQVYLSADRICYESKGVPVDVEVLNTKEDIEKGEDAVVATALKLLEEKQSLNKLKPIQQEAHGEAENRAP